MMVSNLNQYLTKDFKAKELACKHCSDLLIDYTLIVKLQIVRDTFKKPIIINSGYRCLTHNKTVGGVNESLHTKGKAVDIRPQNLKDLNLLYNICEKVFKNNGIGYYKNFIHLDIGKKRRWNN